MYSDTISSVIVQVHDTMTIDTNQIDGFTAGSSAHTFHIYTYTHVIRKRYINIYIYIIYI